MTSSTLPSLDPPTPVVCCTRGAGMLEARLAGETVELSALRAVHWPRERTLFVADVHLGKSATFRAHGVPVPRGATATDLERLATLVARTGATRLVVLGDLLHAAAGRVRALDQSVMRWRKAHPEVDVTLVRGNHDARAGDPPSAWGIEVVDEPHVLGPFLLCHKPAKAPAGYVLCGHVHPGVRITAPAGSDSARVPCFVLGQRCALLPAFGRFTGLAEVRPRSDERLVAVAGDRLFLLPA